MKKMSVLFSMCLLAVGLTACGGSKNPQTEAVNAIESQVGTGDTLDTSQSMEESTETLQSQKAEKTSGTESADETSLEESEGSAHSICQYLHRHLQSLQVLAYGMGRLIPVRLQI